MIERKTVIDRIEVERSGAVHIRLGLLLVEDGAEIDCKWHRTAIAPGTDVDAQIASVNNGLRSMNMAALDDEQRVGLLKSVVSMVHTKEVVAAHRARM
jgi:hypothetical protein